MGEQKQRVAVIFGGQSSEHEVSCKSAVTVISHIDRTKYEPVLIGITKEGCWLKVEDTVVPLAVIPLLYSPQQMEQAQ